MKTPSRLERLVSILGALSLLIFILFRSAPFEPAANEEEMIRAAELMASAEKSLRACRGEDGWATDRGADLNRTGLIGIETSPTTTTLGNLEAKRTVTNPNWAGLIVRLLKEAGVKNGETIAVGASCSFPGLIVAVLSAAKAMNLKALFIFSLGASQWGANEPAFGGLDMYRCLVRKGYAEATMLAVTIGGEGDVGQDMSEEGRRFLEGEIRENDGNTFSEPDLVRNVNRRMALYEGGARGQKITAFINIGGSWANMGTDASILRLKPGLADVRDIPPVVRRGVIQEMAGRGIPVIHLLNIQGLVVRYGLPWDPTSLPKPGEGAIYRSDRSQREAFFLFFGAYVFLLSFIVFRSTAKNRRRGSGRNQSPR